MKKSLHEFKAFMSTLGYCFGLSWKASKMYTIVRVFETVISPFLAVALTYTSKILLDVLTSSNINSDIKINYCIYVIFIILVLTLVSSALERIAEYSAAMHTEILQNYISIDIIKKGVSCDLEMFDNAQFYDKLVSVSNDSNYIIQVLWNSIGSIGALVSVISSFAVLASSNLLYSLIVLIAAVPAALVSYKYTKVLYFFQLEHIFETRQMSYISGLASSKIHAQDIRTYNIGKIIASRFQAVWEKLYLHKKAMIKKKTINTGILEILPNIIVIGLYFVICADIISGKMTVGDFSLYSGMLTQLSSYMLVFLTTIMTIYENKLKIDNVRSFDRFKSRIHSGTKELKSFESMEIKNVSFKYPNTEKTVLDNVSLKIQKGNRIVVVGLNGSGKTTLIKLIMRFYEPDEGEIKINGINIKEYTLDSLRKTFSVYFQNSDNYAFTLRDNVAFSSYDRKDDNSRVLASLEKSGASSILENAKSGVDTYVSRIFDTQGLALSGGQSQKLALSRTFFRDSQFVILDEPSSSLDPESENELFEQFEGFCKGKTALFTSHRLSNIGLANRIVVLENGKIIEEGTKSELLENKGRFSKLYNYQAKRFRNEE